MHLNLFCLKVGTEKILCKTFRIQIHLQEYTSSIERFIAILDANINIDYVYSLRSWTENVMGMYKITYFKDINIYVFKIESTCKTTWRMHCKIKSQLP